MIMLNLKKIKPVNKWQIYLIWLVISIFLLILFKQPIADYALFIVIILLAKDVVWDMILKKQTTKGFEHAPFLAILIISHLIEYIYLSPLVFWLSVIDLILDLLLDFQILK